MQPRDTSGVVLAGTTQRIIVVCAACFLLPPASCYSPCSSSQQLPPPLTQGFGCPPKFGKAVNKVLHITEVSAMQRAPALTITLGHVLSCQCPEVTVKSGLGYYEEARTQNILVFG